MRRTATLLLLLVTVIAARAQQTYCARITDADGQTMLSRFDKESPIVAQPTYTLRLTSTGY